MTTLFPKKPPSRASNGDAPANLLLTATATFDVEAAAGDHPAPLPRFSMLAYIGGAMRVVGWKYPLVIDLAGLTIPLQSRPIRLGYDAMSGVGHTESIRVEQGQLLAQGVVSRYTASSKEVVTSSRNGFPWQASVEEFEFIKPQQQVTVNGHQFQGPLNVFRKSTLGEISFVDLGELPLLPLRMRTSKARSNPSIWNIWVSILTRDNSALIPVRLRLGNSGKLRLPINVESGTHACD